MKYMLQKKEAPGVNYMDSESDLENPSNFLYSVANIQLKNELCEVTAYIRLKEDPNRPTKELILERSEFNQSKQSGWRELTDYTLDGVWNMSTKFEYIGENIKRTYHAWPLYSLEDIRDRPNNHKEVQILGHDLVEEMISIYEQNDK